MRFHQLAAFAAVLTFALMILGSLVHGTGSSLACPDWPLCHGTAFPQMTGGVEFEHSHRLVALSVAVLVSLLAFRARRAVAARTRGLAFLALGLVAVQASLGALTVILRLPPAVSVAHLATSMAVLASLVLLAIESMPRPRTALGAASSARPWLALAALATFAQIVLGAVVRHTGAALACTTVPACDGSVWPDALLPRIQMVHRAGALIALALVLVASAVSSVRAPRGSVVRRLALVPTGLVLVQGALGVAIVLVGAPLALVTAHHATAALLLVSLVAPLGALRSVSETPAPFHAGDEGSPLGHVRDA